MPEAATDAEQRVLDVVRELASELGGPRAARAASPTASLEREVGLGSLERVELVARLETAFGRRLEESALQVDTAAGLARLLDGGQGPRAVEQHERGPVLAEASALRAPATTIHEALWRRAEQEPQRPHSYLREDDAGEQVVTYGRLLADACGVAGGLRELGVARGDTVALMLPTSVDFLRAFQGILIAGGIPVPIYPPISLDRLEEFAARQGAILADAGVKVLITVDRARPIAGFLRPVVPALRHVVSAEDLLARGRSVGELEGRGSDAAFIQYTSGSTGSPKGVLLTHDNLLANIEAIGRGLQVRPTDVTSCWLPLYHDMGLIGSWLFSLVNGLPVSIMSPLAFLARPERWLWTIHERRVSLCAAPNFAYELCVRRIADSALEGLDLSSWRCALNGAEPVSVDTLERFTARFAPHGFRPQTMLPVYGLAESSVALCFPPIDRIPRVDRVARAAFESGRAEAAAAGDAGALPFVSVGVALPGHEVRIVDDAGQDVADRIVGRLIFRGPSMMSGYHGKPEATEAIRLPGGFLDSGDLAYRADGEIHICGRRKDLIIKAGRNLVPQEIEEVVGGVAGVRRGCVAAFGVTAQSLGTEQLVIVAETRESDPEARERLIASVQQCVAAAVGVPPDVVALVAPGQVPKTSSGKIRRGAARDLWIAGTLGRRRGLSLRGRLRLGLAYARHQAGVALGAVRQGARLLRLSIGLLVLVPPFWLAVKLLPRGQKVRRLERTASRLLLWLVGCPTAVEGQVPPAGPFVFVCNHLSYADVPALLALLPADFVFAAKKEVRDWPLLGAFVRGAGHVPVDRQDFVQGVADASRIAGTLRAGLSVMLFPEGTFTAGAGLRPFRLGAFRIALETGAPIVPLALSGTRRVWRDGRWPEPAPIRLWIGPPIEGQGDGFRAAVALRDRAADAIAAECGEPRLDLHVVEIPR
jgi:1-acyl-sn-glycerol-3-phosphate acyltransferase